MLKIEPEMAESEENMSSNMIGYQLRGPTQQERRRVASVVENTKGGDVQYIREIISKYSGPNNNTQGAGIHSDGVQSLTDQQQRIIEETMQQTDSQTKSKNLLHTFNNEDEARD